MAFKSNMTLMADGGSSGKKDDTYKAVSANEVNARRQAAAEAQTAQRNAQTVAAAAATPAAPEPAKPEEAKEPVRTPVYIASQSAPTQETAAVQNYDRTVPTVFNSTVDPALQKMYENAMVTLEGMKGKAPTYSSQYDEQIKSLYEQITGRGPFRYDSSTDPLFQQYRQSYIQQGKNAMRDTMGQAAALTGGYGSSYAQAVGQQQYDAYLQRLADILPETYGLALDAYNAEGDQMQRQLAITSELEKSDYDRYLDKLNQHNIDVQRAQDDADTWYQRMTDAEKQAYNRQMDRYDLQQDYYNRLVSLMATGYTPTKADYNAAGLSEAQGEAIRAAYAEANAPKTQYVYVNRQGSSEEVPAASDKFTMADLSSAPSMSSAKATNFYRDMVQAVAEGNTEFTRQELDQWARNKRII